MSTQDLMSINTVAAKLGLSVHQLRRWELMFGLDIKRGRGQQRQYRQEDLTVLERIKELVEQGWPTSQIRPQIEAEGLITPRLIGVPQQPGNPEVVLESIIGFRNFSERRFIELSKQIDELRQLVISITLKQELAHESGSPWQAQEKEVEEVTIAPMVVEEAIPERPVEEITIGPEVSISTDVRKQIAEPEPEPESEPEYEPELETELDSSTVQSPSNLTDSIDLDSAKEESPPVAQAPVAPPTPSSPKATRDPEVHLDDVSDQNYLTVLGKALDLVGWTDEQADEYAENTFTVPHWDELGRSHAEIMVAHIKLLLNPNAEKAPVSPPANANLQKIESKTSQAVEQTVSQPASEEEAITPPTQEVPGEAIEPQPQPESSVLSTPPPNPLGSEPTIPPDPSAQPQGEQPASQNPFAMPSPEQSTPIATPPAQVEEQDVPPKPLPDPAFENQQPEHPKPTITPVNWNNESSENPAPNTVGLEDASQDQDDSEQQSFDPNQ